jgi:NADH-quinone oxidoreductase subunit I
MKQLAKTLKGLWSLLVGLKITGVEFCKPWLTVHYPRQEVENLDSYRGHIELVPTAEDPRAPRCLICWTCADICPSRCIVIRAHVKGEEPGHGAAEGPLLLAPGVPAPHSQPKAPAPEKIERVLDAFRLNYHYCSLCGLCVQSCPADAIRFSRNSYLAGAARACFEFDLIARLQDQADGRGAPARADN